MTIVCPGSQCCCIHRCAGCAIVCYYRRFCSVTSSRPDQHLHVHTQEYPLFTVLQRILVCEKQFRNDSAGSPRQNTKYIGTVEERTVPSGLGIQIKRASFDARSQVEKTDLQMCTTCISSVSSNPRAYFHSRRALSPLMKNETSCSKL